jgi:CRP/FNR family transcriptional regulator
LTPDEAQGHHVLTRERYARLAESFPFLAGADNALANEFRGAASHMRLPVDKQIFLPGERAAWLPMLTAGRIRVYKIGPSGREITLYRFGPGDACLLSADSILSDQPLPAAAVVELRGEAVLVPASSLRRWVQEHELWRRFVFGLMSHRLLDVLGIVDSVVFRRMDARVATLLLERARRRNPVRITHQEIADELGTSREVVSRILEHVAGAGLLKVTRGRIEILQPGPLAELAAG